MDHKWVNHLVLLLTQCFTEQPHLFLQRTSMCQECHYKFTVKKRAKHEFSWVCSTILDRGSWMYFCPLKKRLSLMQSSQKDYRWNVKITKPSSYKYFRVFLSNSFSIYLLPLYFQAHSNTFYPHTHPPHILNAQLFLEGNPTIHLHI